MCCQKQSLHIFEKLNKSHFLRFRERKWDQRNQKNKKLTYVLPRKNPIEHGFGIVTNTCFFSAFCGSSTLSVLGFSGFERRAPISPPPADDEQRERKREYNENTERNSSFVNNSFFVFCGGFHHHLFTIYT